MKIFLVVAMALVAQGHSTVIKKRSVDSLPVFTHLGPGQNIVETADNIAISNLPGDDNIDQDVEISHLPVGQDVEISHLPGGLEVEISHLPGEISLPNFIPEIQEEEEQEPPTTEAGYELEDEATEVAVEAGDDAAPENESDNDLDSGAKDQPEVDNVPTKPVEENKSACDLCFEHLVSLISTLEN